MFTGIVQGVGSISSVSYNSEILSLTVSFPVGALQGVQLGASIAISGCCLTVVSVQGDDAVFEIVQETFSRTNLGALQKGDRVNFERSLKFGDEVGGHLVSGHIDTTGRVVGVNLFDLSRDITVKVDPSWTRFIFAKGYVALNGASLTVVAVDRASGQIDVSLIPETIKRTTFDLIVAESIVNIEVDRATQAVVNTVERILAERTLAH
jgi:riboflavin synthase